MLPKVMTAQWGLGDLVEMRRNGGKRKPSLV